MSVLISTPGDLVKTSLRLKVEPSSGLRQQICPMTTSTVMFHRKDMATVPQSGAVTASNNKNNART